MSVLVTGASGFLGGRLAQVLADHGEQVTVLARPSSDLRHLSDLKNLRIVQGSLTETAALSDAVRDAIYIYHCAAASTDWAPQQVYLESNVHGTKALLSAAQHAPGLKRFLHVSTTDVYGYPTAPCDESGPLVDVGLPYNRTKILAEKAVWAAARDNNLPVTVARPATIYGPRGKAFVTDIADLLRKRQMAYIAGGKTTGGLLYVDNAVDAMIAAAKSAQALGQAYNLSDGTNATWRDYVTALATSIDCKLPWINLPYPTAMAIAAASELTYRCAPFLPRRPLLTRHAVFLLGRDQEFPIGKAQAELNFIPRISMEEGLACSVAWLKDSGAMRS